MHQVLPSALEDPTSNVRECAAQSFCLWFLVCMCMSTITSIKCVMDQLDIVF